MSTLDRLLGALSRVYDTTAGPILGLRLSYLVGTMQWQIADDTLTTTVLGGIGAPLSIDLAGYTLSTLAVYLASQPGYVVLFLDDTGFADASALTLVPGAGDIATSNGDHIFVATNPNWTYLAALAAELQTAQDNIVLMPLEMATTTANGEWLDLLGSYYAVPRQLGERDAQYQPRIPAEVILPRQNNFAIVAALEAATGQEATCIDAPGYGKPEPAFDNTIAFSGAPHFFNAQASVIYNLFDVSIGYDIAGSFGPVEFLTAIRAQIERLRAAGTHLRNLTLTSSVLHDTVPAPTDVVSQPIVARRGFAATANSAWAGFALIQPPFLFGSPVSNDQALAVLTAGIKLAGVGSSANRPGYVFFAGSNNPGLTATGASTDTASALASTGIRLRGVGAESDAGAAYVTTVIRLAGVGSSADQGQAGAQVSLGGTASSTDAGTAAITAKIAMLGASASTDTSTAAASVAIRLAAASTGTDAAVSALTTHIRLASGVKRGDPFVPAYSSKFGGGISASSVNTSTAHIGLPASLAASVISRDSAAAALTNKIRLAGLAEMANGRVGSDLTTATVALVYRDYWNHPGGNKSVYNTPTGDQATWSAPGDADTIALRNGGIINPFSNFGCVKWVNMDPNNPIVEFKGTIKINGVITDQDVFARVIPGSSVPNGGGNADGQYAFVDTVNNFGFYFVWGHQSITNMQANSGPITMGAYDWCAIDDAMSDDFGNQWDQQTSSYNKMAGLITDYDINPAKNPDYPNIKHCLQYMHTGIYLKNNLVDPTSDGPLKADSWPQCYCDYQGPGAPAGNIYTGPMIYGASVGIPFDTVIPTNNPQTGQPWTTAGTMLIWNLKRYPSFIRDQADDGYHLNCDQDVSGTPWFNDANTDLPAIVQMLAIMRNQHIGGQDYTLHPMNARGNRLDTGPPPLRGTTFAPSASGYVLNYSGQTPLLYDATGETFGLGTASGGGLQVLANGNVDATAANVQQLLYFNNLVYYQDTANTWHDKAQISDAWASAPGDPRVAASGPITPAKMLTFFSNIKGTGVVSGQYIERGPLDPITAIHTKTGRWLGSIGIEYWYAGSTSTSADLSANPIAISYWNNGGLIVMNHGMPNPTTGGYSGDTSSIDASGIIVSGTTTNTKFKVLLDSVAAGLLALQNAGVVTIYRPFHEMNGSWNWYGPSLMTAAQFIAMWRYVHDYFVNTKGLNLIWLWSPNSGFSGLPAMPRYPGDAYVDMVGQDGYTSNPDGLLTDYNTLVATGKPVALAEYGPNGPSGGDTTFDEGILINSLKNTMPKTVLFTQWWDNNSGTGWGMASTDQTKITAALTNPWVLNRGDFSITGAAPGFTPSANNSTLIAPTSSVLTDSHGTTWGIATTSGGQVTKGGVTDTTTSNVAELAYVNSVIWHKNTGGQWYSYTGSGWTGGSTTSPLIVPSASGYVINYAGQTPLLYDATGEAYGLATHAGGTGLDIVHGTTIDTTAPNPQQVLYYNSKVYYQATTNYWYSQAKIGDAWANEPKDPRT